MFEWLLPGSRSDPLQIAMLELLAGLLTFWPRKDFLFQLAEAMADPRRVQTESTTLWTEVLSLTE
jgi:hypothetical protein